jgi:hypothetical protein
MQLFDFFHLTVPCSTAYFLLGRDFMDSTEMCCSRLIVRYLWLGQLADRVASSIGMLSRITG